MLRSSVVRRLAFGAALIGFVAPVARHRLRLPRPVTSVLAWQTPLSVALVLPRGRFRDAAVYGAQMWAYIAHYELPNDDHEALLRRVRIDYPIRIDRARTMNTKRYRSHVRRGRIGQGAPAPSRSQDCAGEGRVPRRSA